MYHSQFAGDQPPSASTFQTKGSTSPMVSNLAGSAAAKPVADRSHAGFGKAKGAYCNDPGNYMKKNEKTGSKVLTLAEMKRQHPEVLAPKELKPSTRNGPPKFTEQPVMNLVTSKNFVVANAVETILAAPKKLPEGAKDFLKKEDYGKVPKYLQHIKQDIEAEYDYIRMLQEQQAAERDTVRPLSDEERKHMLEGLKAKWEQVNTAFQAETHQTKLDTMGKMKRKERNEAELMQIEKDIEKLSKTNIYVNSNA